MDARLRFAAAVFSFALLTPSLFAESAELRRLAEAQFTKGPLARAHWGALIVTEEGETLYARNPDALMTPASSRKLFTAAFAQNCLGFETRFRTEIQVRGEVRGSVLHGDLIIRGDGDPSLGGRMDPFRTVALDPIITALEQQGIRRITGDVVADVSLFGDDILPPDWKHGYLSDYYAAPVDALAFNENVVGVTTVETGCKSMAVTMDPSFVRARVDRACDKRRFLRYRANEKNDIDITVRQVADAGRDRTTELISVRDPALFTAQAVRDELLRRGIAVRGASVTRERTHETRTIGVIESAPLSQILGIMLEDSQNLYAETLLKRAAAASMPAPVTLPDALAAERNFYRNVVGLEPESFAFYDGSGLAPDNLVTARAMIGVVRYIAAPERRGSFLQLMAEPGDPGTLRNRLKPLKGRVFAKTGYINGVAALAGTVVRKDGKHVYFAMVCNHYEVPSAQVREAIDAVVTKIAELY